MINAPIPYDAAPHGGEPQGGESRETIDEMGWKVTPLDERDLQSMKMMEERGVWDPILAAHAIEEFRPEPGEYVVIIGRRQRGGAAEHVDLFAAIRDAATPGWYLKDMDERHPELAVRTSSLPTPDMLSDFLHRNSRAGGGYMKDWSSTGEVPYVAIDGNGNPGVVVIGVMNAHEGTRSEATCMLPTTHY